MAEESHLATLASEVDDARDALLEAAQTDPQRVWTADELMAAATRHWRDTVMMIALDKLITDHDLVVDTRWRVRLPQ